MILFYKHKTQISNKQKTMLLAQIIPYIAICIETRWISSVVKVRWVVITLSIALMVVIGGISAESHHMFVLSEDQGDTMAREREVRHNEPQLGAAFRPHSWYAGEI